MDKKHVPLGFVTLPRVSATLPHVSAAMATKRCFCVNPPEGEGSYDFTATSTPAL